MKKLSVLAIGAVGYVLGAKAGRARYDQIKAQATKVWKDPRVQSTVDDVQAQAKQAGATVGAKVAEAASGAKDKVVDKVSGHDDEVPGGIDVESTSTEPQGRGLA